MLSTNQLRSTQWAARACRLQLPSKPQLRLRTRGLSSSASCRALLNFGEETGQGPSDRTALNPELGSPLIHAAPAYTQTARLASASSSIHHPKNFAFGKSRGRAASPVSWQTSRPFSARTLGSYDTISANRSFATSAMVASKIDGNAIAKKIRESLASEILEKQKANPRFRPQLTIVQGVFDPFQNPSLPLPC